MEFVSIITPCGTPACISNLLAVRNSIRFDFVWTWIVVFGGFEPGESFTRHILPHDKIEYVLAPHDNSSGNALRNAGLAHLQSRQRADTDQANYVYYLDDDNVVHPRFWDVVPTQIAVSGQAPVITFEQCRSGTILKGRCKVSYIDTAQFLVAKNISSRWGMSYDADGQYVVSKCKAHRTHHIPRPLACYNALRCNRQGLSERSVCSNIRGTDCAACYTRCKAPRRNQLSGILYRMFGYLCKP